MKLTLLRKFSILSFVVIAILGIVLGVSFSTYYQKQLMLVEARHIKDYVDTIVSYSMRPSDFDQHMTGERYDTLKEVIQNNVLSEDIKRVKIWNRDREIIFCDEPIDLKGTDRNDDIDEINEALSGQFAVGFADAKELKDVLGTFDGSKQYVEVYVPIKLKSPSGQMEVYGAFEMYQEATPLYEIMLEGQRSGWYLITVCFIALYVSLYQIVKKASKTIEDQDNALMALTDRMDITMKSQEDTYVGTIKALLTALDAKDKYTAGHCSRVTDYAVKIGQAMQLDHEQLRNLEEASLFHDIGKIGVPESILNKKDTLTNDEFDFIKRHPAIGATIIESISIFAHQCSIIRHHHERWDGRGYPSGIAGTDIPLEARILAVADTYDAMTSDRPYRAKMPKEKALSIIRECSGSQFDPAIAKVFLNIMEHEE